MLFRFRNGALGTVTVSDTPRRRGTGTLQPEKRSDSRGRMSIRISCPEPTDRSRCRASNSGTTARAGAGTMSSRRSALRCISATLMPSKCATSERSSRPGGAPLFRGRRDALPGGDSCSGDRCELCHPVEADELGECKEWTELAAI